MRSQGRRETWGQWGEPAPTKTHYCLIDRTQITCRRNSMSSISIVIQPEAELYERELDVSQGREERIKLGKG